MKIIFIFIDGIGLGENSPSNPFAAFPTPGLNKMLNGGNLTREASGFEGSTVSLSGLDATLGVNGLPQSATGQATILSGCNAPMLIGRHRSGFPDASLRHLLEERGLFRWLKKAGYKTDFANAYRPHFFDLLRRGLPGDRYSCTTLAAFYGGLSFHSIEDIRIGKALFMDITNELLIEMGYSVPAISAEEGALKLLQFSSDFDYCLFEYFLSDLAGHMGDRKEAEKVVKILDAFLGTLADNFDPAETTIIISSDHGNLEDCSTREHTLNLVPIMVLGDRNLRDKVIKGLSDLTDLLPLFMEILKWKG